MKKSRSLSVIIFSSIVFTGCIKNEGCTDVTALNFDVNAEIDNGSCQYDNNINPLCI
jgi:hypothetical protein